MRMEKSYRDMGHDIDSTDTPLEAGLGFAVAWDKPGGFVGREALLKQKESGPLKKRLVNVLLESPDHDLVGAEPIFMDGEPVGSLRVGAFGYSLGRGVRHRRHRARGGLHGRRHQRRQLRGRHRRDASPGQASAEAALRRRAKPPAVLISGWDVVPSWV